MVKTLKITSSGPKRKKFAKLIEAEHLENIYQRFLEENTSFIPRPFLHNHHTHFGLVLKQYPLFEDYRADFMYLTKSSAHWRCVLVEIEKPGSKFFSGASSDFHADFEKAHGQILTWKAHLGVPNLLDAFKEKMRVLLGHMYDNPFDVAYVLVGPGVAKNTSRIP